MAAGLTQSDGTVPYSACAAPTPRADWLGAHQGAAPLILPSAAPSSTARKFGVAAARHGPPSARWTAAPSAAWHAARMHAQ